MCSSVYTFYFKDKPQFIGKLLKYRDLVLHNPIGKYNTTLTTFYWFT